MIQNKNNNPCRPHGIIFNIFRTHLKSWVIAQELKIRVCPYLRKVSITSFQSSCSTTTTSCSYSSCYAHGQDNCCSTKRHAACIRHFDMQRVAWFIRDLTVYQRMVPCLPGSDMLTCYLAHSPDRATSPLRASSSLEWQHATLYRAAIFSLSLIKRGLSLQANKLSHGQHRSAACTVAGVNTK